MLDIVSYTVSTLTIIAFLLQFHKTITFKDASGISYISQGIITTGAVTWMMYAGGTKNIAPGLVNGVILIPLLITLYMSLRDNGISKKTTVTLLLILSITGMSSFMFFILSMAGVIEGDFMELIGLLGVFIGGTFTATAFMPQTFRTLKTRDVKSLSVPMTITYTIAQLMWVMLFTLILLETKSPDGIVMATNIWSIITAIIPSLVQFALLYAIIQSKKTNK